MAWLVILGAAASVVVAWAACGVVIWTRNRWREGNAAPAWVHELAIRALEACAAHPDQPPVAKVRLRKASQYLKGGRST